MRLKHGFSGMWGQVETTCPIAVCGLTLKSMALGTAHPKPQTSRRNFWDTTLVSRSCCSSAGRSRRRTVPPIPPPPPTSAADVSRSRPAAPGSRDGLAPEANPDELTTEEGSPPNAWARGWHHIALCWEQHGETLWTALYCDGYRVATQVRTFTAPDVTPARLWIGSYANGHFPGHVCIDDVRVSRVVRYRDASYPRLCFRPPGAALQPALNEAKALIGQVSETEGAELSVQAGTLAERIGCLDTMVGSTREVRKAWRALQADIAALTDSARRPQHWARRTLAPFEAVPVSAMRKIGTRWADAPAGAGSADLASAAREWQSFQIVILPGKDVERLNVRVDPLRSPEASIDPNNVEITRVAMVGTDPGEQTLRSTPMYPDALMPLADPLRVSRNEILPLWFTVYVPPDTPPGDYRGKVVLSCSRHSIAIPVKLHVWGFRLPVTPTLKTAFGLCVTALGKRHRVSGDALTRMRDEYVANMLRHRVSPKTLVRGPGWDDDWTFLRPRVIRGKDGALRLDFVDYDRQVERYLKQGLNTLLVGGRSWAGTLRQRPDKPQDSHYRVWCWDEQTLKLEALYTRPVLGKTQQELADVMIHDWYAHLVERGWGHMAYSYLVDEPPAQIYPIVSALCDLAHQAEPRIQNMITKEPHEELQGVDIWCPLISKLGHPSIAEELAKGREMWTYVCCGPRRPYPNFFIDYPAVDNRIPFWMAWKYGCGGSLYYEHALWVNRDPWTEQRWARRPGTLGDGMIVSPSVMGRSGVARCMIPAPSRDSHVDEYDVDLAASGLRHLDGVDAVSEGGWRHSPADERLGRTEQRRIGIRVRFVCLGKRIQPSTIEGRVQHGVGEGGFGLDAEHAALDPPAGGRGHVDLPLLLSTRRQVERDPAPVVHLRTHHIVLRLPRKPLGVTQVFEHMERGLTERPAIGVAVLAVVDEVWCSATIRGVPRRTGRWLRSRSG